jgi:hypothetical protein
MVRRDLLAAAVGAVLGGAATRSLAPTRRPLGESSPKANAMKTLPLEKIADRPATPDGFASVTQSVANDDTLLFLFIEQSGADAVMARTSQGLGTFPVPRLPDRKRFRLIARSLASGDRAIDIPPTDIAFPFVDLFSDGRVLLVAARSELRGPDDFDRNAMVFEPVHNQVTRFLAGDGIEDVFVDSIGRVWVSYFDEGVFGNFGWGYHDGATPVGAAGLVCFDATGTKSWEFPGSAITDCYALNVTGAEAVIFYYTDFPICRIGSDFHVAKWNTKLKGCHALAISGNNVLLTAQYEDSRDIGYRGRLGRHSLEDVEPVRFSLPDGSPLPKGSFVGRGPHLTFFAADAVYRASLS